MDILSAIKKPLDSIFPSFEHGTNINEKGSIKMESFLGCTLSPFLVCKNIESGYLFYNILTLELISLSKKESDIIKKFQHSRDIECFQNDFELFLFLYYHFFIIKENQNSKKFVDEAKNIIELLCDKNNKKIGCKNYTILTTTDCNAHCYYCYEHGSKKITMSTKTAEAVGQYILSNSKDDNVEISLRWFGGEPLMQVSIIDKVCGCLNQHKRLFHSSIVSNGYLFTEEVIQKAKEVWHLKKAQITLDGPEDVYNRTKAYVNPTENPFFRVLNNIQLLAENEIHVNIRINYAFGQYEETIQLFNELEKRFSGHQMITVYVHGIFQEISEDVSAQQRKKIFDDIISLKKELINRKLSRGEKLPKDFVMNYCMADSETSVVILPDGRLTSCEHYNNEIKCWGSVFSEDVDEDAKAYWAKRWELQEECETCFYYPLCIRLKHCPDANQKCYQEDRDMYRYKLEQGMLNAWEEYKKEHDLQEI